MKTNANNTAVRYEELNEAQQQSVFKTICSWNINVDLLANYMIRGKDVSDQIEIFITSPTSVDVKKK
jgi:hypothetical protein